MNRFAIGAITDLGQKVDDLEPRAIVLINFHCIQGGWGVYFPLHPIRISLINLCPYWPNV